MSYQPYGRKGPVRRSGAFLPRMPERSQRLVCRDGLWYYCARECELVGPYRIRENAEKASRTYTRFCRNLNEEHLHTLVQQHIQNLLCLTAEQGALQLREGEMEIPEARHARVSSINGHWFFNTREGEMVGPYASKAIAEEASETFLQFVINVDRKMISQLIATMKASTGGISTD